MMPGFPAGSPGSDSGVDAIPPSPASPHLRILFFLLAGNFDRVFISFLESLVERGHSVHVVLEKQKRNLPPGGIAGLDGLGADSARLTSSQLPQLADRWLDLRTRLRLSIDFLRYLEPEFRDAHALRERARARAPRALQALARPLQLSPLLRTAVRKGLRWAEAAAPIGAEAREFVRAAEPDVVLVSPLLTLGSRQSDWIRLARELGIATVLPVASWDNLTNKGVLKEVPSLTIVWNEAQADEAVRYHGVPRDRVVTSGAHAFDHWFDWAPSSARADFVERLGMDGRPYLLYACSSSFIDRGEQDFVVEWVAHLRASHDEQLRNVGVLVRPHPTNAAQWRDWRSPDPGTVVWPREGATPIDPLRRSDYFDTIHHAAAVVGVNTSAFIDAAIVGRPSFTLLHERFRAVQEETLHFAHLVGPRGLLLVASSWAQHLEHLDEVLDDPRLHDERLERFVREFVRPRGIDQPAGPLAAGAVEVAARGANDLSAGSRTTAAARARTATGGGRA